MIAHQPSPLKSLRWQLVLPLLIASAAAALVVAGLSWKLGRQWALWDLQERFKALEKTVSPASFPLTPTVTRLLASLSGCELIAFDDAGEMVASTLAGDREIRETFRPLQNSLGSEPRSLRLLGRDFLALGFLRQPNGGAEDSATRLAVLFDQRRVAAASRRAALLPLATGFSTILLLGALIVVLTGRLAKRVAQLQRKVEEIAGGNFSVSVNDSSGDELGLLGAAVNKMAQHLHRLWQEINRQQSQKLLHQMAAGMAHQLRNTLTGARLALELHQQSLPQKHQEEVEVALREMTVAEDYIQRILVVGSGEQQPPQAVNIVTALMELRDSHAAIAKHLRVSLDWSWSEQLTAWEVTDGSSFRAALSNLVLNALQAAKSVDVEAQLAGEGWCLILVSDDGAGIDSALSGKIFEPFVSSKPEGLGLGLPVVQRAAEKLGGTVKWRREAERTVFEFRCQLQRANIPQ